MSSSPTSRWRGRTVAALLAAAVVALAASGSAAQAAPSAQARLASVATKAPDRTVTAIVQFKPRRLRAQGPRARALPPRPRHRRLPPSTASPSSSRPREAQALRRNRHVLNAHAEHPRARHGVDAGSLATTYPKTIGADKLWQPASPARASASRSSTPASPATCADFKNADGSSRVVANVITNPDATRPGDDVGHGTHVAGHHRRQLVQPRRRRPAHGDYVGIAPEANLIAVKAADDAGNSTVLDVITALQFVVDHKDDLNIRVVNLSLSSDTPGSYQTTRSTRPSSTPGTPASSSSPPPATAATRPTRSSTPRATTRT